MPLSGTQSLVLLLIVHIDAMGTTRASLETQRDSHNVMSDHLGGLPVTGATAKIDLLLFSVPSMGTAWHVECL